MNAHLQRLVQFETRLRNLDTDIGNMKCYLEQLCEERDALEAQYDAERGYTGLDWRQRAERDSGVPLAGEI